MFRLLSQFASRILPKGVALGTTVACLSLGIAPNSMAMAAPNGTWLSQPQIWFHRSNDTLNQVMQRIKQQGYRYVFLDVRKVPETDQQLVTEIARQYDLYSIAWIQSPQYRALSVEQIITEAQHTDGIQVDDHFFANYSLRDFYALRSQYNKPLFCSIQPFQAHLVPPSGCDQLDVQCYTPQTFSSCLGLADRLKAIVSLSTSNTLRYRHQLGQRWFNVFLWPYSSEYRELR